MHEKSWKFYEQVVSESGIDVTKLENYIIDAHADVHNLIMESDVICGGQSSTTIESLFMGKRVILPLFCEYKNTDYFKQFPWKSYLDLFEVAEDMEDFERVFYKALQSTEVSEDAMKKRRNLYSICFDDLTGNAIGKYTKTISNVIKLNQKKP